MKKTGISRRRFMKTGLAWVAGTAAGIVAPPSSAAKKEISAVSRTSLKPLQAIPTTCQQCPAGCGIIAYLDGERLVQLLGNPRHPHNRGAICAKGIAGINLVNDPERLMYPMKRIGPRGSGQWAKITWDEAYYALSNRIKKMIREGRIAELLVDQDQDDPLLDRFIAAVGATRIINRPALKNLNRDTAFKMIVGSPFLIEDVGNSRTILNFGANPYANHDQYIGFARRLVQARVEKGAKLYTFDVRMSETAAKSDAWYPVKAGTDGLVALTLAKVIMDKGLADKNFIEKKTNCSLSLLKSHLSQHTPEIAEKTSGVRAEDIERLAVEFATRKPSVAIIGGGVTDHMNGSENVRCTALLNCLVGSLEREGGLLFPRSIDELQSKAFHLNSSQPNSDFSKGTMDFEKSDNRIDMYFAYLSNPAYDDPDCQSTLELLKDEERIPFLVVMDTHLTETAVVADMVLPAATFLEGWGISALPQEKSIVLNLRQPVVSLLSTAEVLRSPAFEVGKLLEPSFRPRGEAEEIGNFCLELARRIEGPVSKSLPFKNTQDYITQVAASIKALETEGGLKNLKNQGHWVAPKKESQLQAEKVIPSRIQKIRIYSEALRKKDLSPLPEYQPLDSYKKKKKGEFILTTFKSNLSSKGTANSKWAREIQHENRLWVNREVAKKLGLNNGDRVRVISSVGALTVRVLTTSRIHPESLAIAEGLGHTAVGNVAQAKSFKSIDQDTDLIWWKKEGQGVNPNEIIERKIDPIGGGQGLKDTLVRIEKV